VTRLQDAAHDVALLNAVLTVEHAVVFGIATAGAQLPAAARTQALAYYDAHRRTRDALTERVFALGGSPAAALPAYADVVAASPAAAIVALERAAVRAYLDVIGGLHDKPARLLCVTAFGAEAVHLAEARRAAGVPPADAATAFVTGD
jgi:hypothetical protein